jgi:hypothetical protein
MGLLARRNLFHDKVRFAVTRTSRKATFGRRTME